jgi:cytochrome P450
VVRPSPPDGKYDSVLTIEVLLHRAVLHDPETYPDPEAFKPERYLKKVNGKLELDPSAPDPRVPEFGAGRR